VQRNSDGQHNPFLAAQNAVAQAVFRHMTVDGSKQFKLREALFCLSEILSIKVFIPGNMELKVPTLECTLFSTLAPATATSILCNSMQTLE